MAEITSDNSPSRRLVAAGATPPAPPVPELEEAVGYARAEKAASTRRAYQFNFNLFYTWCDANGLCVLPADPATVAAFLASEAKRGTKPSTIARRLAPIRYVHKLAGYEPPTNSEAVKATLRGIRRTLGGAPAKKAPATAQRLLAMVSQVPNSLKGTRDRALLLLGFANAFRRSELVLCANAPHSHHLPRASYG